MSDSKELAREKRRRRLRSLFLILAAMGAYAAYRQWGYQRFLSRLQADLPARMEKRRQQYEDFLLRCESALEHENDPDKDTSSFQPVTLPPLTEILSRGGEAPTILLAVKEHLAAQVRAALFEPDRKRWPLRQELLDSPTLYLTEHHDPFFGLGAWEFLRHLPDKQGNVLLLFPASGQREAPVIEHAPLHEWLKTYDRVISFDTPHAQSEGLCRFVPASQLAARQALKLLAMVENEAGGPSRYLALRTEGEEAGLLAAVGEPRIRQVELAPAPLSVEQQQRIAALLAMLGDRALFIERGALSQERLEELRRFLVLSGQQDNLMVR